MAVYLSHLPLWLWGGSKTKGGKGMDPAPSGYSSEWGLDNVRFPLVKGSKVASPSSKVNKQWKSREERRIDEEYDDDDDVLVPSDGGCLSGSESYDSDGQLGGLNPMPLNSRMMMRQTTVSQCWFLVIGMVPSRNWRQGLIFISIIISSWMALSFSKLSMLMGKNIWRNGFQPYEATELAG